jgi:hypothetical protein
MNVLHESSVEIVTGGQLPVSCDWRLPVDSSAALLARSGAKLDTVNQDAAETGNRNWKSELDTRKKAGN